MEPEPVSPCACAMEPGERRRWGIDTPRGVALTGQVPPVYSEERPPCTVRFQSDVLPSEMPPETSLCHSETPMAVTEMPQEVSTTAEVPQEMLSAPAELPTEALPVVPSAVPPVEAGKDPCEGELPPSPEKAEIRPCEVRCLEVLVQPRKTVPRGSCLIHNWQEERATNHLDFVPDQEEGSEGFIFRHGHRGLLVPQSPPWPTTPISTMKDHYRPPHSVLMLGQGQREAAMQSVLYQKYRQA
ncbi:uncharacterized protein [Heliangelus exortis]|uniref:uncharacterized protein n=1 Tax=Heliangelus exortis TaxID=472823 RepID=UPI003A919532